MSGVKSILKLLPPGGARLFARLIRGAPKGMLQAGECTKQYLLTLASSRRYLVTVRQVGHQVFKQFYDRAAGKAGELDALLDALEDVRYSLGNKHKDFQEFLEKLRKNDGDAWKRLVDVDHARRVKAVQTLTDTLAKEGLSEALRTKAAEAIQKLKESPNPEHRRILATLAEMAEKGAIKKDREITAMLAHINSLDPTRLDGLAAIVALARRGKLPAPWSWDEFLVTGYNFLLEPLGKVAPFADRGLDMLLYRGLMQGPGLSGRSMIELQGMWGHLLAAADAVKRFEKDFVVRLHFEVKEKGPLSKRFIDTRIQLTNRTVDQTLWNDPLFYDRRVFQEVKTNLGLEPSLEGRQMQKDLVRHATPEDRFRDMIYSYHPAQGANLQEVREKLLTMLKTKAVRRILAERKIPEADAEAWLKAVLNDNVHTYAVPAKGGTTP